jgi:hypothetical protein
MFLLLPNRLGMRQHRDVFHQSDNMLHKRTTDHWQMLNFLYSKLMFQALLL